MSDMRDVANLRALRRQMTAELVVSGVSAPELEARLLLASAMNCAPGELIQHDDEMVTPDVAKRAMALMMRRITGEPVARILGRREFWSLDFQLSPDTLVPRPDTETLVQVALDAFPQRDAPLRFWIWAPARAQFWPPCWWSVRRRWAWVWTGWKAPPVPRRTISTMPMWASVLSPWWATGGRV